MTLKQENQLVANSILDRNYIFPMQHNQRDLVILCGSCCCDCIRCCAATTNNSDTICTNANNLYTNFLSILNWYVTNKLTCNISLKGLESYTTTFEYLDILYKKFSTKRSKLKPAKITITFTSDWLLNTQTYNKLIEYWTKFKLLQINLSYSIIYTELNTQELSDITLLKYIFFINSCEFTKFIFKLDPELTDITHKNINKIINSELYTYCSIIEVTSNKWNNESVNKYLDILALFINKLDTFKEKDAIISSVFKQKFDGNYLPHQIILNNYTLGEDMMHCAVANALTISCVDLSIPICCGLTNKQHIIGKFVCKNNRIKLQSITPELFIIKDHLRFSCLPHCEQCNYVNICSGFCMANSNSEYGTPLVPVQYFCSLLNAKYAYLLNQYNRRHLFDDLSKISTEQTEIDYLVNLLKNITEI